MIVLQNQRLRVELSEPGEHPNDTFRFDRAAYISEVTLDNTVHFCANEVRNLDHPSSGGRGLCCEYKADYSGEVKENERFPKLGIGLFPRKRDGYSIFDKYESIDAFPIRIDASETEATFATGAIPCLGYAMESVKRVWLEGNTLFLSAKVTNVGEKTIVTEEYCHNFLSVDGMAAGPGYRLEFPKELDLGHGRIRDAAGLETPYLADGSAITFAEDSVREALIEIDVSAKALKQPFEWKLIHTGERASVAFRDDIRPVNILLWTADHEICGEIIQKIELAPGASFEWTRSWTFEAES